MNITTQSQELELSMILSTSSSMDGLQIFPKLDEILTRAETIARYSEWEDNSRSNEIMIVVEHNERNIEKWHIWYVLRSDQEKIIIILPSHAIYYHANRGSNKRIRIIDTHQICDGHVFSIFVSKDDHKFLFKQFFHYHSNQKQNDELNYRKSTMMTFDNFRRRTQLKKIMTTASISLITDVQDDDEILSK